jgi:uncharacterized protein with PQ loop repeat
MKMEIIGYLAAILTTIAFFPQTYQAWKTRDLQSISLKYVCTLYYRGSSLDLLRVLTSKSGQ